MNAKNSQKAQWFTRILWIGLFALNVAPIGRLWAGEKIITLLPTWGETLEKLLQGSEHQLVGVSEATVLDDRTIPFLADQVKIYREAAMKLKPTLWIKDRHSASPWGLKEALAEHSRVLELGCTDWQEFVRSLQELAQTLGLEDKAKLLLQEPTQTIETIGKVRDEWLREDHVPPRRAFRIGFMIDSTEKRIAGSKTVIEDIFNHLGVENAFGELEGYPRVQNEWISKQNPDHLLESYSDSVDKRYEGIFKMGLQWPEVLRKFQTKFYSDKSMVRKP